MTTEGQARNVLENGAERPPFPEWGANATDPRRVHPRRAKFDNRCLQGARVHALCGRKHPPAFDGLCARFLHAP